MRKEGLFHEAGRGSVIGLLSGLFTAVAMLLFLFVYSAVRPDAHIGSTAVLAPLSGGVWYTVLGHLLGAIGGTLAGLTGFLIKGPLRCALFGGTLMGAIGLISLLASYYENPERFSRDPMLMVGLCVVSGILGGVCGGAIVGMFSRSSWPNQTARR